MQVQEILDQINEEIKTCHGLTGRAPEKLRQVVQEKLLETPESKAILEAYHCRAELQWEGKSNTPIILLRMYFDPEVSTTVLPFNPDSCMISTPILMGVRKKENTPFLTVKKVKWIVDNGTKTANMGTMTLKEFYRHLYLQLQHKISPILQAAILLLESMTDFGDLAIADVFNSTRTLLEHTSFTCEMPVPENTSFAQRSLLSKAVAQRLRCFREMTEEPLRDTTK